MARKDTTVTISDAFVDFDLSKSIEDNATDYFEASKLARRKIKGIEKAIIAAEQRLTKLKAESALAPATSASKAKGKKGKEKEKKKWYEQYRWFFTSDNFLVVGGRDAQSNEEIVKKRMSKDDRYFHAEVFGAPHCFLQVPLKSDHVVPLQSMKEAATFAATFSKAWEEGRAIADSYSVSPEQVSKSAKSGESMGTGAFMIYGEREWFRKTPLSCAIGYNEKEKKLMAGPLSAVKKHCVSVIELHQGTLPKTDAAKKLQKMFEEKGYVFTIDAIVALIPNGGFNF